MKLESIRILEGNNILWDDICIAYRSKIDDEDYIIMHSYDSTVLNRLVNTKPFFSQQYIVELHIQKVTNKLISQLNKILKSEWVTLILVCTNKETYDALAILTDKGFNGYKISEKFWTGYVLRRLKIKPQCNLSEIYKTLGGRFELTDVVIDLIMKSNGRCTVASIKRFVGKRDSISIDIVWFNILLRETSHKKDIFRFLEEYRYGYNFVMEMLGKKFEESMKLYADFENGELNELHIREYKKESKYPTWILKKYIEVFNRISIDEILLIGQMIQCTEVSSPIEMFALIGRLIDRTTVRLEVE